MSTRGFFTFVAGGVEKTAYQHHDSYPDGFGLVVLDFLRAALPQELPEAFHDAARELEARVRAIRVVTKKDTVTADDVVHLAPWTDTSVSRPLSPGELPDWYQLLRGTQFNVAAILEAGVIEDASEFPQDSLFAEWGYVVDLDEGLLEVYKGFQHHPHRDGRFATREPAKRFGGGDIYYPVRLVKTFMLHEPLPTRDEFLDAVKEAVGDDSW